MRREIFFEYMTRPDVNAKWCTTTQEMTILNDVETPELPQAMQDTAAEIATGKVCNYTAGTVFSGRILHHGAKHFLRLR